MPKSAPQKLLMGSIWTKVTKGALMMKGVTALLMIHVPQHLARGVHTTCAAIPQGTTQAASARQTSAFPRMKVTPCLEVKKMPPA